MTKPLNPSGIHPVGAAILVRVDPFINKSKGGIVITTNEGAERQQMAQTSGQLVDIGDLAFKTLDDCSLIPQLGDRVCFQPYAGGNLRYKRTEEVDGEQVEVDYRLMNDNEIWATQDPQEGEGAQ